MRMVKRVPQKNNGLFVLENENFIDNINFLHKQITYTFFVDDRICLLNSIMQLVTK